MATTTMPSQHQRGQHERDQHDRLERVPGDDGHAVAPPRPDDILFGPEGDAIKTLIASGDKGAARALFRRLTGADEREADDLVTRLDMQINPQAYPEVIGGRAAMAPSPGGGIGVLVVIGVVIAALIVLAIVQAS